MFLKQLYGNSSLGACYVDYESNQRKKESDKKNREHYSHCSVEPSVVGEAEGAYNERYKVVQEGRNSSNDVRKEDHRDTVTDSALVDSFSKPHNERCACSVAYDNYNCIEPSKVAVICIVSKEGLDTCGRITVSEKEVITNRSNDSESNSYESGDKIHLLLVGLTKLSKRGKYDSEKLNNNGCIDVRLYTKREQQGMASECIRPV